MSKNKLLESASQHVLCDIWNDLARPEVLNLTNNCFSYACASIEAIIDAKSRAHAEATPQPGDSSGIPKNILLLLQYRSLPFWLGLAERDGLKRLDVAPHDPLPVLPKGQRLVALTYNPKYSDYHWLRQERDGFWTHKPDSGRPPTRYDSQRQIITDPRRADLYYDFPSFVFMSVPEKGIEVRMKKEWLKFFNSLDDATYGNYAILRHRLIDLSELVKDDFIVMSDYLKDLSRNGDEQELKLFWHHLRTGKRLPNADGLLPISLAHAPLGIAWQSVVR